MSGQCSICLGEYDEPVCIPCGHVYCVGCITDVVNRPDEAVTARCPTCRTEFHLVVPDLTYLPKKYHPFVISPLRRIYLPAPTPASPSPSTSSLLKAEEQSRAALSQLEAEVAKYKSRVAAHRETEEMLMQQCERHQAKAHAYREREWEARKEVRRLGKEARDVGERVMELEGSLERVIEGGRRAEERAGRLEGEVGRLRKE
ncbi:hypothetical protein DFP72DRAFT_807131 [Ephemerocybe angulata]|uniref:RING-type domain-containing protein n=1 Tax=Ephemerocybe angulata TaxID=980116 RepID=A0A8H6I6W0_9AGAR|nr:hypothetical protein DFP72DRAFT_807131 [Tulosesus angulatus]